MNHWAVLKGLEKGVSLRALCGGAVETFCIRGLLLRQCLYDMSSKVFIDFIMPWNGLLFTGSRVYVKVVAVSVSREDASIGNDFLDRIFSFHKVKAISFILCFCGTSSRVISV